MGSFTAFSGGNGKVMLSWAEIHLISFECVLFQHLLFCVRNKTCAELFDHLFFRNRLINISVAGANQFIPFATKSSVTLYKRNVQTTALVWLYATSLITPTSFLKCTKYVSQITLIALLFTELVFCLHRHHIISNFFVQNYFYSISSVFVSALILDTILASWIIISSKLTSQII